MENYEKNLEKAEQSLKKLEKLIVLAQVSNNKKLMLLCLEEIEKIIRNSISAILHFDYLHKKVKLYSDSKLNFREFEVKSSRYLAINISELDIIKEVLQISEHHKKSPMEFLKNENLVILSEDQKIKKINMSKLSDFQYTAKKLLDKIKFKTKS